jgi:hypothetical protein
MALATHRLRITGLDYDRMRNEQRVGNYMEMALTLT